MNTTALIGDAFHQIMAESNMSPCPSVSNHCFYFYKMPPEPCGALNVQFLSFRFWRKVKKIKITKELFLYKQTKTSFKKKKKKNKQEGFLKTYQLSLKTTRCGETEGAWRSPPPHWGAGGTKTRETRRSHGERGVTLERHSFLRWDLNC